MLNKTPNIVNRPFSVLCCFNPLEIREMSMKNTYLQTGLFNAFDRLQQQLTSLFGGFPSSIRSDRYGSFPKLNVGTTDDAIEIAAFVPGVKNEQAAQPLTRTPAAELEYAEVRESRRHATRTVY